MLPSAAALLDGLFEHPVLCFCFRCMGVSFRRAGLFTLLFFWTATTILSAAEKTLGTLTVHDSLTSPNQPATIEATLTWKGLLTEAGLGGEPVELLIAGQRRRDRDDRWRRAGLLVIYPKGQRDCPIHRARRRPLRESP